MSTKTGIEWTDATVNFWWGCTKVGPGCDHCYAETWDKRVGGAHWGVGAERRKIASAGETIRKLNRSRPGSRVFVQSMSDIFDLEVPLDWFAEAWDYIVASDRIQFQVLTKRISAVEKRLNAAGYKSWPKHAGLMVTVVNQDEANRDVPRLLDIAARLQIPWTGVSYEPVLGPVDFHQLPSHFEGEDRPLMRLDALRGRHWCGAAPDKNSAVVDAASSLDWVIMGGESGPGARPMNPDWARSVRDQCSAAGVPFFWKQWGEWRPPESEREAYDTSTGRAGSPPAFIVSRDGTVHCFENRHIDTGKVMLRVGKQRAGRLLDGVEHNGFPGAR